MKVALVDVDGRHYPNLALMKLSAWHKAQGDSVDWYFPLFSRPDRIYASKVFTFSPDYIDYAVGDPEPIKGGTGYDASVKLPNEIENMLPDYSIYPEFTAAYGFLSRGCIRNCPWCVVPRKEGNIRPVADIETVAQGRHHVILMDNNFLANDPEFVREQLEKVVKLKLWIDFNQGLDARLVNEDNARLLAKCHWRAATGHNSYIRFSCDTRAMIPHVKMAISLLRAAGFNGHIFVYFLAINAQETADRIESMIDFDKKINPFAMPFRNLDGDGKIKNDELRHLARWCNVVSVRKSCSFNDYKRNVRHGA